MKKIATSIFNVDALPAGFVNDPTFAGPLQTLGLGEAAGSRAIYVHIDRVKPGAASVKYHSHSAQEEFFLVLKGEGKLRLNDAERRVKAGDFFAKPAGEGIAHQFINDGSGVLEVLDCGLAVTDDAITYPDDGIIMVKPNRLAFRSEDAVATWSSDPNDAA